MRLDLIKEIMADYLSENNLYLYDIKETKENGQLTLSLFIGKKGANISIDELASCNQFLSGELDKIDQDLPPYNLEVSSPGALRDIRNLEEAREAVGSYIYLEKNGMKYLGDLVEIKDEDILVLRVNLKGRFKNFEFKYDEINKLHYDVKF